MNNGEIKIGVFAQRSQYHKNCQQLSDWARWQRQKHPIQCLIYYIPKQYYPQREGKSRESGILQNNFRTFGSSILPLQRWFS